MTFENGGISDKQGNAYENRYLARVLIRLLAEEITSVVVEPVGKYTDVCEQTCANSISLKKMEERSTINARAAMVQMTIGDLVICSDTICFQEFKSY